MDPASTGRRLSRAGKASALLLLTLAALSCSRPVTAWIDELQSDEPFTRRLAAAALGSAPYTEPDQRLAVQALFAAHDPADAALAGSISTSLDALATPGLALARTLLRAGADSPDARRQLDLVRTWLLRTRLPIDDWLIQEAAFAPHPHWHLVFDLLRQHGVELDPSTLAADPGLRTLVLLQPFAEQIPEPLDPAAARARVEAVRPLLELPHGLEAALAFFATPTARVVRLHTTLTATPPIPMPWQRVITATLFRQLDSGEAPVAEVFGYLGSGSSELEEALVANTALADERLAELSCAALAQIHATSPAALTTLETLARDDDHPRLREAARSALERLKK